VNTCGKDRVRKEQRQHLCKRKPGVRHPNQHLFRRGERTIYDNGGGSALLGAAKVAFVFSEGEIARLGAIGRREPIQSSGGVANNLAFEGFGDFSGSKGH